MSSNEHGRNHKRMRLFLACTIPGVVLSLFVSLIGGVMPGWFYRSSRCWDSRTGRQGIVFHTLSWASVSWGAPFPGDPMIGAIHSLPPCQLSPISTKAAYERWTGLPFRSMYWYKPDPRDGSPHQDLPIYNGLRIGNTPFGSYGADGLPIIPLGISIIPLTGNMLAFSTVSMGIVLMARGLRRHRRRMLGRCDRCGYSLRNISGQCPECGHVSKRSLEID